MTINGSLNKYGFTKSKESVEKVNSHVRACVKDAVEGGFLLHDFTRKAVITWTKPSKKESDKHLDVVESEKLMKAVLSKLGESLCYSLILLGLTSGMRYGEMVGLTRKDFDFSQNRLTINKTWGYMKRSPKGFGPTKNEQSNRRIKMDKATMLHFEQLFESNPENPDDLFFYNRLSKYKVISNTQANDALKDILHSLGITPITIHGLRHTHASVLLYKNVSIYYVSERLGHSSIETTQKRYAHVVRELREKDEQKTMEIYNEIFHL
jgi:integrase